MQIGHLILLPVLLQMIGMENIVNETKSNQQTKRQARRGIAMDLVHWHSLHDLLQPISSKTIALDIPIRIKLHDIHDAIRHGVRSEEVGKKM